MELGEQYWFHILNRTPTYSHRNSYGNGTTERIQCKIWYICSSVSTKRRAVSDRPILQKTRLCSKFTYPPSPTAPLNAASFNWRLPRRHCLFFSIKISDAWVGSRLFVSDAALKQALKSTVCGKRYI